MSVFGGDSWAREAQYRKRRVDDLVTDGLDGSSHKKLSSGKYACLVCPHNPVLESPLALSVRTRCPLIFFFNFSDFLLCSIHYQQSLNRNKLKREKPHLCFYVKESNGIQKLTITKP